MKMSPKDFFAEGEALSYRRFFARVWSEFLRDNYSSPTEVARLFNVTVPCARNWWNGVNAPEGWIVAKVFAHPDLGPKAQEKMRSSPPCSASFAAE